MWLTWKSELGTPEALIRGLWGWGGVVLGASGGHGTLAGGVLLGIPNQHSLSPHSASSGVARAFSILKDLGLSPAASDAELVHCVCAAVSMRAARLCAAALAAILSRLQRSRQQQTLQVTVATGGQVFEQHSRYCGHVVSHEQGA